MPVAQAPKNKMSKSIKVQNKINLLNVLKSRNAGSPETSVKTTSEKIGSYRDLDVYR